MRVSVMLVFCLLAGLLVLTGAAQGEEAPAAEGPWTIIETTKGVFRINSQTGVSDIFRDGDKPRWDRIAEPEAATEPVRASVVALGITVEGPVTLKRLVDGKVVEFKAVRICEVKPHGPFSDAGISTTDWITQVAGKEVESAAGVEAALAELQPGETLAFTLYRIDQTHTPGVCEAPRRKFEEVTVRPAGK